MSRFLNRLGVKIFISYLLIVLLVVIVLALAVSLSLPSVFERHMAGMGSSMGAMMGRPGSIMTQSLFTNFRAAVREAITVAALVAVGAALIASLVVSRQVLRPVHAMTLVSQRIAQGHYTERVPLPGDIQETHPDELAQLALSFNQMAGNLEQTENMRRQLIGDITHELRTPLTIIKGTMEGLLDGVLPPNEENYQLVHQESDRLQRLVDDLQELSRVESGAYDLHRLPVAVSDLLTATRRRLERQYEEKGVGFQVIVPAGLPAVLADEDRASQVLLNLAGNALQYTPSGGQVTISARQVGREVEFKVQDTGIGIPQEHLPNLFTRFYRVDKSRSRAGGGSGIGLTIAKHLVEAHQGRIWVESPGTGGGSTFYFTLPVV